MRDRSSKLNRLWLAALVALAGSPLGAQEGRQAGTVTIEPASLQADGRKVAYELGTLHVQENRSDNKSRLIGVGFARFRCASKAEAPPVFLLPGGPGSSILNDLREGQPRLPGLLRDVERIRRFSDLIIVDQRGFSGRGETVRFLYRNPGSPLDQPGSAARSSARMVELAKAATTDCAKRGIDLRGYTVIECADDVRDLAKALNYPKIALMGGSFGSQWSFAIMRRHPEIVGRALLGGVEPLDCGYDMPSHVMAAVRRIWWDAEQDEKLKPYLPPGGLMEAATEVLQRLQREPIRVTLTGVTDSQTKQPVVVTLGHEDFQRDAFLRGTDGPAFILSAYHHRYDAWAYTISVARRGRTVPLPLIGPLIDTSLGVTPRRKFLLRTDPALRFLGTWNFEGYLASTGTWPSPDVGDEFRTEKTATVPVLFVHGDWDTQTPIENTYAIAPYFPNSRILVVERGGHGAMNQLVRHFPETHEAVLDFLRTGDPSAPGIPARVSLPKPQFAIPDFPVPER